MFLSLSFPSLSLSTHCSRTCEGAAVTCCVFLVVVAVVVLQLCSRMFPSGPASWPRTFTKIERGVLARASTYPKIGEIGRTRKSEGEGGGETTRRETEMRATTVRARTGGSCVSLALDTPSSHSMVNASRKDPQPTTVAVTLTPRNAATGDTRPPPRSALSLPPRTGRRARSRVLALRSSLSRVLRAACACLRAVTARTLTSYARG